MLCVIQKVPKPFKMHIRPPKKICWIALSPDFLLGSVGRDILFCFFEMSKNALLKLHKHFMKDLFVKQARYFILYISLQALFLHLYFYKILPKLIPRVISFSMFFVHSINERYHIRALLATAPSVVQWIVRLVPCEIVTSDKRACSLICVRGKSISVALL